MTYWGQVGRFQLGCFNRCDTLALENRHPCTISYLRPLSLRRAGPSSGSRIRYAVQDRRNDCSSALSLSVAVFKARHVPSLPFILCTQPTGATTGLRSSLAIHLFLGGGLLLLRLALLLAGVAGQRLLQDLEDLLVGDLLVRLELLEVKRGSAAELGDTVLGNRNGG